MIQILLLILKIIGITLLAVVGFILVLLAVVLFVPFFYRVRIIHTPEKTQVKARVSFLFPLLVATVEYLKKLSYKVRIFGFAILDSDKPKKEKQPKEKKVKEKKQKEKKAKKRKQKTKNMPVLIREEDIWAPLEPPGTLPESEAGRKQTTAPEQNVPSKEEKQSVFQKIRSKIQKTRETISEKLGKWKRLWRQKNEVQRIWAKPETRQALSFAWDKLKHVLKHIFPRKIMGYVAFGMDNPATTGQVLGILSMVYARTGQILELRPNFMEKQLECDVELKGRIQVVTLLVIAVKVFMNQELRQLIADVKGIKDIE